MQIDTPIERADIRMMSNDDLDALILSIQERRLAPITAYQVNDELKQKARIEGLGTKLDKQCKMFEKDLVRVDKAIEQLEKRALNIRAIRLELEDI